MVKITRNEVVYCLEEIHINIGSDEGFELLPSQSGFLYFRVGGEKENDKYIINSDHIVFIGKDGTDNDNTITIRLATGETFKIKFTSADAYNRSCDQILQRLSV